MIIKKLILTSFGKFQNKTVEFKKGINLIYGENEAGKSTIHSFIEGMFYGFFKPYMKNKKYTESYDKYFPWDNSSNYSGVLILRDERQIRIERNFMKNKDSVQVFYNETGEEITNSYAYDPVIKMNDPALVHIGLNQSTYRNTISIGQMESKTSEELIMEVKDNIINLGETNSVEVSVNNVMKSLASKRAAIGTERSKKSKYGRAKENLNKLLEEKKEATKVWEVIKTLKIKENEMIEYLQQLEDEKKVVVKKMNHFKSQEFEEKYLEAKKIQEEINRLKNQLEELKFYSQISKDEINDAIAKTNNIELLKRENEQQEEKIKEISNNIISFKEEINAMDNREVEIGNSEKISRDVYKYEEFVNSKKYIEQSVEPSNIEELSIKLEQLKKSRKGAKVLSGISLTLAILLLLLKGLEYTKEALTVGLIGVVHNVFASYSWIFPIAVGCASLITIIYFRKSFIIKKNIKILSFKIDKESNELKLVQNRMIDLEERQQALLNKYDCEDIIALKALKDKKIQEEIFYEENFKRTIKLEEAIDLNMTKLVAEKEKSQEQKKKIEEIINIINSVMQKTNSVTYEGLNKALDRHYEYKRIEQEIHNKEIMFNQIIKGESFEKLEMNFNNEEQEDITLTHTYDELEEQLKAINDEIVNKSKEISALGSNIANEENSVRKLVVIEDAINLFNKQIEAMAFKLESYNIIEKAIEEISKITQNNFAPKLNKSVSKTIAVATDYKYSDVKINPEMEISVVDNDTNKLIRVEDLSAGTIDLMYFALRLGITDIINEDKTVPIILDDCFVQYDEHRLVKILELLSKIDRQILIFTCHGREKKLLQRISNDVNYIAL